MTSKYKYAFLVGAAKSGTTSLAELLNAYFDIELSELKESDYFSRNYYKGSDWYEKQFKDKNTILRLDASTSYSAGFDGSSYDILRRIKDFAPESKIVYIVRDPIERTWASYWHAVRGGFEPRSFEDSINKVNCPHITGSKYYNRLAEIKKVFDEQSILILSFQEFKQDNNLTVTKIAQFLDLTPYKIEQTKPTHSNQSFQWRGPFFWMKYVPTPVLKALNRLIKALFPSTVMDWIKAKVSKSIPGISKTQAQLVIEKVKADADQFEIETEIKVKTSKWW